MSCIQCGKPFPGNRELATIPDAARIAFDPARQRVWRVCSGCGFWNLLGTESALIAMPELEARFAASNVRHLEGAGIGKVSGALELVRLDDATKPGRDDTVAKKRSIQLVRGTYFRFTMIGLYGLFLLGVRGNGFWAPLANMIVVVGLSYIAQSLRPLRFRKSVNWRRVRYALAIVLAPLVATFAMARDLAAVSWFLVILLVGSGLSFLAPGNVVNKWLANGKRLKIDQLEIPDITMDWTDAGDITLHNLPNEQTLEGGEARRILKLLLSGMVVNSLPTPAVTERALDLLRSAGGTWGIFAMLEDFRREQDGRVVVSELPELYKIALDLALTPSQELPSHEVAQFRTSLSEATEIAIEAERLDKGE